jgi:hypothetical protein
MGLKCWLRIFWKWMGLGMGWCEVRQAANDGLNGVAPDSTINKIDCDTFASYLVANQPKTLLAFSRRS